MSRNATIYEIAANLRLSSATVSMVLNNRWNGRVSVATAERVNCEAIRLGYRRNSAAAELRLRKSTLIGVILSSTRNPFHAELAVELHAIIRDNGYMPLFAFIDRLDERQEITNALLERNLAGLISEAADFLPKRISCPVVSFIHDDPRFDLVQIQPEVNVRMAFEHLKRCGHQTLGGLIHQKDSRTEFLLKLASDYNFELRDTWIAECRNTASYQDGYRMFEEIIGKSGGELPSAFFAHNDVVALGAMRRMRECGLRIPTDISIIANDNIACAAYLPVGLTSIGYTRKQTPARALWTRLKTRMESPGEPRVVEHVTPELFIRESCAAPSQRIINLDSPTRSRVPAACS